MAVAETHELRRVYKSATGYLRRRTKATEAVRWISFEIEEGELFGLLGPNRVAGKSREPSHCPGYPGRVGKATILLLIAGKPVWKQYERVPSVGENLNDWGYPEWYVFQLTQHSGRIAHDCRLEVARPPEVEPTDTGPDDEGLLTAQ